MPEASETTSSAAPPVSETTPFVSPPESETTPFLSPTTPFISLSVPETTSFISPSVSETTPFVSPSVYGDSEKLSLAPQKKTLIRSAYSWCAKQPFKHPFLSAFALYVTLVGVIAGAVHLTFNQDVRYASAQIPFNKSGIALIGRAYLLDVTKQTLSVEWEIVACGEYRQLAYSYWAGHYGVLGCGACDREVDIYLNSATKPAFSYNPVNIPLDPTNHTIYAYNLNAFAVEHSLGGFTQHLTPVDTHRFTATVFAIEKATNRSVPIIAFAVGEGPSNFVVHSVVNPLGRNNYTYDSATGPTTVEVESMVIVIHIERSQLTRAFTLCLLLINLALTVGSVYVTVLVLTRRERIHEGVFLFPVTVILTIPALRNLYPAEPPFGIYIDTFGFFSQMMIVALCSLILLYVVARPSTPVRRFSNDSGTT